MLVPCLTDVLGMLPLYVSPVLAGLRPSRVGVLAVCTERGAFALGLGVVGVVFCPALTADGVREATGSASVARPPALPTPAWSADPRGHLHAEVAADNLAGKNMPREAQADARIGALVGAGAEPLDSDHPLGGQLLEELHVGELLEGIAVYGPLNGVKAVRHTDGDLLVHEAGEFQQSESLGSVYSLQEESPRPDRTGPLDFPSASSH